MRKIKGRILEKSFGAWNTLGSGVKFTRKIRDKAEEREKRLDI